jgi:hypothetical protein
MAKILFLIFVLSGVCFGQTPEDELERERILKLYGSKKQYNNSIIKTENSKLLNKIQKQNQLLNSKINFISDQMETIADTGHQTEQQLQNLLKRIEIKTSPYREHLINSKKIEEDFDKRNNSRAQIDLKDLRDILNNHIAEVEKTLSKKVDTNSILDSEVNTNDEVLGTIEATLGDDVNEDSFLTGIMSKKMRDGANIMMKQNPFSVMTKDELKQTILNKTRGTAGGNFLRKSKRALRVLVEVSHDKDAIPKFISLINKPKKMKMYGFSFLGVFLFVFIMNMRNSKSNFLKKMGIKLGLMLFGTTVNCLSFYLIFQDELAPGIEAFKRAW